MLWRRLLLCWLWFLPGLLWTAAPARASKCYTCSGGCYAEAGCNCEFGYCEAPFCFTERKPQFQDKNLKFQVVKGCAKDPSQSLGCQFVRDKNSLACLCQGEFCNAHIETPKLREPDVECFQCAGHSSCSATCLGHYCSKDLYSGVEACGYGQPYLPYTISGGLLEGGWAAASAKACITTSLGIHKHAECVCRGRRCNRAHPTGPLTALELSQVPLGAGGGLNLPDLYTCFSCSRHAEDNVLPPECQEETCRGQFCILSIETRTKLKPGVIRNAGCLNTTHPGHVHLGCSQKWRGGEHEIIHCACVGDLCNVNLHTAYASAASNLLLRRPPSLLFFLFAALARLFSLFPER